MNIQCNMKNIELTPSSIVIPTKCPSCGSELKNDGTRLFCVSDNCPRKIFHRIINWIKVAGIDNFGEALAQMLFDQGKLKKITDLYNLKKGDIESIEGWGDQSADKIIQNINTTREKGEDTILSGIGIPGISEKTTQELLSVFESLDSLMVQKAEDISKLKGFSDISATNIVEGLKKYKDEILELKKIICKKPSSIEGPLQGKTFCFTGAMSKPRTFFQNLVKKYGGENSSSVTKDLTYLVCNEDVGSSKSQKAKKYGVAIIPEKEFLQMIRVESLDKEEKSISGKTKVENIPLF